MATLTMVGWRPGLKTVTLIELLRSRGGMGLREAKSSAEQLLSGQAVSVSFCDETQREAFRHAVEEIGVEVEIDSPR